MANPTDGTSGASPSPPVRTPTGRPITQHAQESLLRHGFKPPFDQVDDIMDRPTRTSTQADGATVYIQRAGPRGRKYHLVIEGTDGIVTGMRDLSRHELNNLGQRYGFDPNP
jgi:hypothetical protein